MEEFFYDAVRQNVVCMSNLRVRKIDIGAKEAQHSFDVHQYERILLLTKGDVKGCDLSHGVYTEFEAPHMIVLEKDTEYDVVSLSEHVEMYEISALRHNTGDIVNPENLIRENYPFDTARSFEDQINVN